MPYEHLTGQNTALLLIDHQAGTMSWVKSIPFANMKRNMLMLAKTARILGMPTVLASSMETVIAEAMQAWEPTAELQDRSRYPD